jgi:hypothetical protein
VDEEADPRVERHPTKNEVEHVFDCGKDGENDEVDQPWREESWIGGVESFVRSKDREEDGGYDASASLAACVML